MKKLLLLLLLLPLAALLNTAMRSGGPRPVAPYVDTTIEYRGFYISHFGNIINNPDSMAATLKFIKDNKFNRIMEYDLWRVLRNNDNYKAISNFNDSAKLHYGVKQVAAVVGSIDDFNDHIVPYNNAQTNPTGAFNYVNLENEFWNGGISWPKYAQNLRDIYNLARQQPVVDSTELYIGWLTPSQELQQADTLVKYADRILVHDYFKNPSWSYIEDRINVIGLAAMHHQKVQQVIVLFDSDISRRFFKRYSYSDVFNSFKADFNASDLVGKQGVKLVGYAIYKE